jgi:uncharacterized protein DUF1905
VVITFDAELWIWEARSADTWIFVSLPAGVSEEIGDLAAGRLRGFGSLRVRATIGGSRWRTSIFPDSPRNCYRLGIKRTIRKAEGLGRALSRFASFVMACRGGACVVDGPSTTLYGGRWPIDHMASPSGKG